MTDFPEQPDVLAATPITAGRVVLVRAGAPRMLNVAAAAACLAVMAAIGSAAAVVALSIGLFDAVALAGGLCNIVDLYPPLHRAIAAHGSGGAGCPEGRAVDGNGHSTGGERRCAGYGSIARSHGTGRRSSTGR